MSRGETIFERHYHKPPGVDALVRLWTDALVTKLLQTVWTAYDQLHADFLRSISWDEDYDDLERSITQELELAIHRVIDPFLPCTVQHGPFERETRSAPPAQPPQYDIAFVWNGDSRVMWPLEAKVLKSDAASELHDYINTINTRYLLCTYAPFSNAGAMLGYLKSGTPTRVLQAIEAKLGHVLQQEPTLSARNHKVSNHHRTVPAGRSYPAAFRCHHLVMVLHAS